jgi:hypothetical protein
MFPSVCQIQTDNPHFKEANTTELVASNPAECRFIWVKQTGDDRLVGILLCCVLSVVRVTLRDSESEKIIFSTGKFPVYFASSPR